MKNIIEIDRLNFDYNKNIVFKELSLSIKEGSFTTIIGLNGSGKTTLTKLMLGLLKGNSVIMCEGIPITPENLKVLRKEMASVSENPEATFINETVKDEIAFTLENLNLPKDEITKRINNISFKLKIKNILEKNPYNISDENKFLTSLASALVLNPKLLIIDNGFSNLKPKKLKNTIEVLKKLNKEGMTIINTTSNPEEVLYGDEIILLHDKKVYDKGKTETILNKEEIFDEIGIELPFIISLSSKLRFYNLIKENYYTKEQLVNDLWK